MTELRNTSETRRQKTHRRQRHWRAPTKPEDTRQEWTQACNWRKRKKLCYPSRGSFRRGPIEARVLVLEPVDRVIIGRVVVLLAAGAIVHGDQKLRSINDCLWEFWTYPPTEIGMRAGLSRRSSKRRIDRERRLEEDGGGGRAREDTEKVEIFGWSQCQRWEWGL